MESTSSFGYWIRRQRKALDLTQQVLADQVGCSLAAIKKIESDERRPSRQIAERLADVLNVPVDQREKFLEVARGIRSVNQLSPTIEPETPTPLPTGIVTFLFTDIEDSTKLWERAPEKMQVGLQRHRAILQEAISSNGGTVFQIIGDAFCAVFSTSPSAISAAVAAQRELHQEPWNLPFSIRVRMGIHTGEGERISTHTLSGGYASNQTLNRVARILKAAHGGQVLLSLVTKELIEDSLPANTELRDMGEHHLKNLARPEHLFQLNIAGLPSDFPPLNTIDSTRHNLPIQLTSFVGREGELSEIKQLLTTTHLLTLTGPGGTGKTRLALQLATESLEGFPDGVWLVELAPLADPMLVTQTVASALGVREQPGRTIIDALLDYVRAKNMLLILDNCEHLIETCAQLTHALLRAAPRLKVLATSRETLGIAGETVYRVPSLPLPKVQQLHDFEALSQNDCVRLFVDRAVAAYPSFHLKEKNALAIADICRRLDGIPLALELAAARTKVFLPEEIARRLDDRFRLLTGGSRTAMERHQTLFALIEWSHNLLSEAERVLLRRLAVFAGGWSFEAAQAVCGEGLEEEVLDVLTHLVDKSLVAVEEETEEARYRLPETIRQYARDKLFESGEAEKIRDRHLDFFVRLAETAERKLRSAEQLEWLNRVETEHDNLRTALAWSLESSKSDLASQLAGALYYFWLLRGYFSEGQKWLDEALALSEREQSARAAVGETYTPISAQAARRAKVLYADGWLQMGTLNIERGRSMLEESLRLWRELGDKWWMAVASEPLALIMTMEAEPELQKALAYLEEGVALARQIEDPWPLAVCLVRLGDTVKVVGADMAAARRFLEEGVALARRVGDKNVLSDGLRELGSIYYSQGNLLQAASTIEEALREARAIGSTLHMFLALMELVCVSCLQKDLAKAKAYCLEVWAISKESGSSFAAVFALLAFGLAASFGGELQRGVHLFAASDMMVRQRGAQLTSVEGSPLINVIKQAIETARAQLGPAAFQAAWAEGGQMTIEQALALATENEAEDSMNSKLNLT